MQIQDNLTISDFFKQIPEEFTSNSSTTEDIAAKPAWWLLDRLEKLLEENHPYYVEYRARGYIIIRNSIIYPSSKISPFSIISKSFIGPDVKIGSFCEISKSVLMEGAKAGRSDYIGRSVLGFKATVSGNVRIATRRVDLEIPLIKDLDVKAPSNRIGSFIGDKAFVASSVLFNPFTFVSPNSKILPFQSLKGIIRP